MPKFWPTCPLTETETEPKQNYSVKIEILSEIVLDTNEKIIFFNFCYISFLRLQICITGSFVEYDMKANIWNYEEKKFWADFGRKLISL